MSTQVRSGGGGGRTKSKAGKENKENAGGGADDQQQQQPQQQQPLQQKGGKATNNNSDGTGTGGGDKPQKGGKGTDNSSGGGGSKGQQDKQHQQQTTTHTIKTKQPTAEQIRIAQITDIKSGMDDPKIQEKIQKLMETTQRSEEDVCCALQECDNDLDRAVIFLLETLPVGAFATTSKKKKNKSQNKEQNESAPGDGDWDIGGNAGSGSGGGGGLNSNDSKDRRGPRSGGPGGQRLAGGPGGAGGTGGRGGRGSFRDGDRGGDRNGFDRGARGPRGPPRDGRDNGPGRGSYGGGSRGGRGGGPRVGTRGPGPRDQNRGPRMNDHQEIDAWDPVATPSANDLNKPEESSAFTDTWGDWDNEEYTGSLSDTKVFTPSTQAAGSTQPAQQQPQQQAASQLPSTQSQQQPSQPQQPQTAAAVVASQPAAVVPASVTNPTELSAPPGLEQQILNPPQPKETDLVQQYSTTVVSSTATAAAAASNTVQYPDLHPTTTAAQHLRQALEIPQINSSASLSAEQSQYFNTLSSQNSNLQSSVVNSFQPSTVQYPTTYGSTSSYSDQVTGSSQQPPVRRQRARVPPPSKIPSSAVEMPGDSLNNIGYLDVQFGGLDFGTDDSFDSVSAVTDKFSTNSLEQNTPSSVQLPSAVQPANVVQQPDVSDYQSKSASSVVNNLQPKSNLTSSLQSTQILPGQSDALSASQNDSLSSSYSQRNASTVVPSSVSAGVNVNSINSTTSTLEQLTKTDPYSQSTGTNAGSGGYQNVSYSTSSQANKTSSYPSSAAPQGYNNSSYSSTQVSTNTYPASTNNYSSYNQSGVNSYQQPSSNVSSSVVPNNNSSSSVGVSTVNQSSPNLPVNNNNVSNNSSNTNSGYLSSQYPVSQTSSAFPSQQSYQNSSQNVYGNSGLNSNTGYSGSTSTSSGQYSNFSSSKLKDTPVSTQFESVASSTAVSNQQNQNSANNNSSTGGVSSSSSLPNNSSSVVSTTTKSGSGGAGSGSGSGTGTGGVVPNIPMVSPYIQPGVPFYQQPVYSYEELQMIQQRMSHVPGYYDMNYQTPTSLGAAGVRDANLGSVAYSTMSDGRFTRTDNNSSPVSNVPSTMSQQTGSGGPMLNLPYAYFYGGNVMPGGFQYGTPAIYPQQMATNATSGGQFQKPAYNSGYGTSGYDTLSQTGGQDYNKNPYPSSGGVGQQSKGQTVSNPQSAGGSGSDIAPSMYGKSHVALNKVNSYEKQSFHSGTPPPYNIAGTQTAGATSGQPYGHQLYIPTIPTHHNINMHQAMHQMDNRSFNSGSGVMRDSNSSGQRPQSNSQGKTATKQGYSPSTYWTAQN